MEANGFSLVSTAHHEQCENLVSTARNEPRHVLVRGPPKFPFWRCFHSKDENGRCTPVDGKTIPDEMSGIGLAFTASMSHHGTMECAGRLYTAQPLGAARDLILKDTWPSRTLGWIVHGKPSARGPRSPGRRRQRAKGILRLLLTGCHGCFGREGSGAPRTIVTGAQECRPPIIRQAQSAMKEEIPSLMASWKTSCARARRRPRHTGSRGWTSSRRIFDEGSGRVEGKI